jgi:hypothetical protein
MMSSHEEGVVSDSAASPIDQYDMNDDEDVAAAVVVGRDNAEATNTNSDASVDINGSTAVTSDATTSNEPGGSDIDKVIITDDDNHSHQDSDADYTEFLEDVFMQVPPPEDISWSDIIERNVQQMQQEQVENGKSDAEDENSDGEFTAFMNTLATAEDPDVVAKRAKKQAEFAGFVAFVETPDALGSTDFLPPRGDGSDDENSVEKAWEEVVSGMAPPVDAAPLLTWALSWLNPAAWYQPAEEEVTLEKKEKEVDPTDECMSETDCASEVSSRSILMV